MLIGILWAWIIGVSLMGIEIPILKNNELWIILGCLVLIVVLRYSLNKNRYQHFIIGLLSAGISFNMGYFYAQQQLNQRLSYQEQQIRTSDIIVYVDQINQLHDQSISQKVEVLSGYHVSKKNLSQPIYWLLRIPIHQMQSNPWQKEYTDEQDLKPEATIKPKLASLELGQYYRLTGEVRPNHSYANKGVFDQEQWAIQQNIMASFKVTNIEPLNQDDVIKQGLQYHIQQQHTFKQQLLLSIEQQRLAIRKYIMNKPLAHKGLILALLTGDQSLLDQETKHLFQTLGISHLLAISGPHILILAIWLTTVIQWVMNRYYSQYYLYVPRIYILCVPFMVAILFYTAFVGFEIPALRTLFMSSIVTLLLFLNRQLNVVLILSLSASLLLWVDSFSVLSASFWLSFGASFILLRIYQILAQSQKNLTDEELAQQTYWNKIITYSVYLWQSQWKIFIALFPLVMIFFQKISWLSPLVNLIAIPLLGAIIVPIDIMAYVFYWISADWAYVFWWLIDHLLGLFLWLMMALKKCFSVELIPIALTPEMILLLMLAVILFFLPKYILPKSWMMVCILAGLGLYWSSPKFELSILDIGQGQAVLLRGQNQNILIDTGGNYDENRFSIGQNVVVPFLLRQGIAQLDKVILSHLDQDHSGALPYIAQEIKIKQLMSNENLDHSEYLKVLESKQAHIKREQCYAGQQWNVTPYTTVHIYSPEPNLSNQQIRQNRNEHSCVVYIQHLSATGKYTRFLIMGDAGYTTESYLMQHYPDLKVDVLILGHHGSKYSTSEEFLDFYQPKLAIASAGFNNRYRHPSLEVIERLQQRHIPLMTTIQQGNISFTEQQGEILLTSYRQQRTWLNITHHHNH